VLTAHRTARFRTNPHVAQFFIETFGIPSWLGYLATGLIQCALLLAVPFVGAMVFVWMERKVSARIQDRLGPTRCGGKFGWLQLLADGLKLITKEDLRPADADRLLFLAAPYISLTASYAALLALPFSYGWVPQQLNVAVFFIIAVMGIEVFGVILAGYASASKWSLFGGMREAAQVVSYEVPLGMCIVVPVLIAGTMDLVTIGQMQSGLFINWFIFHDPFTFITFWVYFTCATASVNRAPFDLAEAESELVAGFHTEYSGFRWLSFFMAEYGSMFTVSALAAILFFGGWNGPIPIATWLGLAAENGPLPSWIGNFLGLLNFVGKAVAGVTFMIWVRWTLPRLRIDQVMKTCLKYCTPIAAVMFLGATIWTLLLPGGIGLRSQPYALVREETYPPLGAIANERPAPAEPARTTEPSESASTSRESVQLVKSAVSAPAHAVAEGE
jgi:NADH-quinone oxidoreductase subunit H